MRPQRLRGIFFSLPALTALAGLPGCGSEPPVPAAGTKEFEAAKQEYQNIRKSEYKRDSLDPTARAKPLPQVGGR